MKNAKFFTNFARKTIKNTFYSHAIHCPDPPHNVNVPAFRLQ